MSVVLVCFSSTVVALLRNKSYNLSSLTDCDFIADNLHLRKSGWLSSSQLVVIIVAASRIAVE